MDPPVIGLAGERGEFGVDRVVVGIIIFTGNSIAFFVAGFICGYISERRRRGVE